MFPGEVTSSLKRLMKAVIALHVLSAFMLGGAHGVAANPLSLQCPPDVFGKDYERFTDMMAKRLGYSLSPQLYGSQEAMTKLVKEFETLDPPPAGSGVMALYFTDIKASRLIEARCAGDCGIDEYSALAGRCAMEMGGTCLDFAVVMDGKAQCLMIPKPNG